MIMLTSMLTNPKNNLTELNFFDKLFAQVVPSSSKHKTHNFADQIESVNYEFEKIDSHTAQMTGYGRGVNPRDYIILTKERIRYRVEAIEYYSDPPNLWTALLIECNAD